MDWFVDFILHTGQMFYYGPYSAAEAQETMEEAIMTLHLRGAPFQIESPHQTIDVFMPGQILMVRRGQRPTDTTPHNGGGKPGKIITIPGTV